MNATLTRLAMATAALMLGHQVASKALRDAVFLSVWPTTSLPLMMMVTAGLAVGMVPLFAKLLARFGPERVVFGGFLASAVFHAGEWWLSTRLPWVVVFLYLHIGGFAALLLSGFWSIVGERFDPRGAKRNFGRIAAAGTVGGLIGSLAAERAAVWFSVDAVLLMLAGLHALCALGLVGIGRFPVMLPATDDESRGSAWGVLRSSAHVRTIAALMVLTTAAAAILDYLLKWRATSALGTGPDLLQFFAVFYGGIQVVSFIAQTATVGAVRTFGIGRTITALPAGISVASAITILLPFWPVVVGLRGFESVLRGSLFRSGYELLFVPMDATERRRVKAFLDVTCDRVGEAVGAGLVQVLLLTSVLFLTTELLAVVILLAVASWAVGRRLDRLYLDVVERQLVKHGDGAPLVLGSEAGWTIIELTTPVSPLVPVTTDVVVDRPLDPRLQVIADLRSGDRERVEAALGRASADDRGHVAQVIELLAWDDVVASARQVLERAAAVHLGMMIDALVDARTDFAIRRRLPRLLTAVGTPRAVDGVLQGLEDARFEVRYQCSRSLDRMLAHDPALTIDAGRILALVDREVSVPVGVWQSYGLIDQPEREESSEADDTSAPDSRNIEHVFSLLATILPREPLQVALRGLKSRNPGLRGLAIEYLEQVLPHAILSKLRRLTEAPTWTEPAVAPAEPAAQQPAVVSEAQTARSEVTPSSSDAPAQSDPPPTATPR